MFNQNQETTTLLGNNFRRPSSPQAIPGLPLIEIRRPSALSQFEFGYFVNSPDIISGASGLTAASDNDCAPLLLSGGAVNSRKSSDGLLFLIKFLIYRIINVWLELTGLVCNESTIIFRFTIIYVFGGYFYSFG